MSIKVLAGMSKKRLMFFAPVYTVFKRFPPRRTIRKKGHHLSFKRGRRRAFKNSLLSHSFIVRLRCIVSDAIFKAKIRI